MPEDIKLPGRPAAKVNNDFGKMGLDLWEIQKLKALLSQEDMTLRQLQRKLIRTWLSENRVK